MRPLEWLIISEAEAGAARPALERRNGPKITPRQCPERRPCAFDEIDREFYFDTIGA